MRRWSHEAVQRGRRRCPQPSSLHLAQLRQRSGGRGVLIRGEGEGEGEGTERHDAGGSRTDPAGTGAVGGALWSDSGTCSHHHTN